MRHDGGAAARDASSPDLDGDGIPDAVDPDVDGDGIPNAVECGAGPTCVDSDGDGTPDVRDLDSDGDTILDADEGTSDPDADGVPSFRDLDSDDDGTPDRVEAGDSDLATRPVECAREIDPSTGALMPDGMPDFVDDDSDNDGLSDAIERRDGLDFCNVDTDGDGVGDLAEDAYARAICPDPAAPPSDPSVCTCGASAACVPGAELYVILPYGGAPEERDVEITVPAAAPPARVDVSMLALDDSVLADTVDASQFVKVMTPACLAGAPTCWTAPPGVADADAVTSVDPTSFHGVAPGTSVRFRLTLQNDFVHAVARTGVFVVVLEARADGSSALARRLVWVAVPCCGPPAG